MGCQRVWSAARSHVIEEDQIGPKVWFLRPPRRFLMITTLAEGRVRLAIRIGARYRLVRSIAGEASPNVHARGQAAFLRYPRVTSQRLARSAPVARIVAGGSQSMTARPCNWRRSPASKSMNRSEARGSPRILPNVL